MRHEEELVLDAFREVLNNQNGELRVVVHQGKIASLVKELKVDRALFTPRLVEKLTA